MCLGIAADAVCCAGASFCSCACCCCKSCCGSTFKEQIKLSYIILNIVMMLFTVICLYWIQQFFVHFAGIFECSVLGNPYCLGVSAVYRMSFVLACFYFVMLFMMTFRGEVAKVVNEDFFGLKILFIFVFFFGSLYIPYGFFEGYVIFARIISMLYLLFQIIMLIDVFYLWGQNWIAGYESGNSLFGYLLVIVSLGLYAGSITLNVFNFIWFDGCSLNIFMNVFTIMLVVVITVVQLLGWNPQGSLLCSGAMALYITYQSFSAQASGDECNTLANSKAVMAVETTLGFIMSTIALLYLTFATKEKSSNVIKVGQNAAVTAGFLESQEEKDEDEENQQMIQQQNQQIAQIQNQQPNQLISQEEQLAQAKALVKKEELAPYEGNQYILFHFIMFITVVFMGMMITNWGSPDLQATTLEFEPSELSYWIRMICAWLGALLYIWTLIAPHVFPDRNF